MNQSLIRDELELLDGLVDLAHRPRVIELGCGAAQLSRRLLERFPASEVTALEVDERQHAKNVAVPQPGITFMKAGAQAVPLGDAQFDLALMLKSLHHVPVPLMAHALAEVARLLKPGGHLYVSEPVFGGPLNEVMRLFHDEQVVRAAAQAALDAHAVVPSRWGTVRGRLSGLAGGCVLNLQFSPSLDPLPEERVWGPQGAFAAKVEPPGDATLTEQFVAWTGRRPRP